MERWLGQAAADPAGYAGYRPASLRQTRSTWRSVRQALHVPTGTLAADLDLDELVDRFSAIRPGFRSDSSYRSRLRLGRRLYLAWLCGDPVVPSSRHGAVPGGSCLMAAVPIVTIAFPLRVGMSIELQYPLDLRAEEVDRICLLLHSMVMS
ncbi:hypothetical protein GCM10027610_080170 [Dactylosporangium cerinum]